MIVLNRLIKSKSGTKKNKGYKKKVTRERERERELLVNMFK